MLTLYRLGNVMTRSLAAVLLLVVSISTARAQEPPPAYPAPPVPTPPAAGPGQPYPPYYPAVSRPPRVTTRITRPSAIYGELAGKGLAYSIGYDYCFTKYIGVGGSFSYMPTLTFFSPYMNVYPVGGIRNSMFIQGGLQLVRVDNHDAFYLWENVEDILTVGGFYEISAGAQIIFT